VYTVYIILFEKNQLSEQTCGCYELNSPSCFIYQSTNVGLGLYMLWTSYKKHLFTFIAAQRYYFQYEMPIPAIQSSTVAQA